MGWTLTAIMLAAGGLFLAGLMVFLIRFLSNMRRLANGLFRTDSEYLAVRSADNVRLLSDAQVRALEHAARAHAGPSDSDNPESRVNAKKAD